MYALGDFDTVGGQSSRGIGKWDGEHWVSLSGGSDFGIVHDAVIFNDGSGTGDELHVAGDFSEIGGIAARNIAKWTGSQWKVVGTGVNGQVRALAVVHSGAASGLYAAHDFYKAGGVPVNRIAKWDGEEWTSLGELGGGVAGGPVNALAEFDDGNGPALYVGGSFTHVYDDASIHYLAKWDGYGWSALPILEFQPVTHLEVLTDQDGLALYAWTASHGAYSDNLGRWNGKEWMPLPFPGFVRAIATFDSGVGPDLYVMGSTAPWENILRWTGSPRTANTATAATNSHPRKNGVDSA